MAKFPLILRGLLALTVPQVSSAEILIDPKTWCEQQTCRTGNSIHGPGYSTAPWTPYESDDPLVWVADACLGYFLTRDTAVFRGGEPEIDGSEDHITFFLGAKQARVHIFNFPFDAYGVFQCQNTTWPEILFSSASVTNLQQWATAVLAPADGWTTGSPRCHHAILCYRNDAMEVTIRAYQIGFGNPLRFQLEADYFGPPVMMQ